MKKALSILGCLCFMLGFAMATGVDQNPVQAVYCVVLMAGALVCIKSAERMERRASEKTPSDSPVMGRTARYQDAA